MSGGLPWLCEAITGGNSPPALSLSFLLYKTGMMIKKKIMLSGCEG